MSYFPEPYTNRNITLCLLHIVIQPRYYLPTFT